MDIKNTQPVEDITLLAPTSYANNGNSTVQGYTMEEILNEVKKLMLDSAFPVGSIYITDSNADTCPIQTKLGGKWSLIKTGRVLQQADSSNQPKSYISAGIPNIKGAFLGEKTTYRDWYRDLKGAFYLGTEYGKDDQRGHKANYDTDNTSIAFDASKGATTKNIYRDDCTTVQPEAYAVNIWRRTS